MAKKKPAEDGKTTKVALVSCDDWTALFVDGVEVRANHSLDLSDVLDVLGIKCESIWVDDDYVEEHGFPKTVEEARKHRQK